MRRREFLSLAAVGAGAACSLVSATDRALSRARAYLLSRQDPDGAWRSKTYGLLSDGDSLTGLALHALLTLGVSGRTESAVHAGTDYLRRRMAPNGALGMSDPSVPDYPNYSTAFALRALIAVKPLGWRDDAVRLVFWLRSQQFSERLGWTPDSAPYGAWGMGGEPRQPPNAGHVDLSMTRHVLEALTEAGVRPGDPALGRARTFLDRCRNAQDGGFSFSPVVEEANKAGREDGRYRSYGTAVADGIRTSRAVHAGTPQVASAQAWLARNHRPHEVPGFDRHPDPRWRQGLFYYYAATAAPNLPPAQRYELTAELVARQRPDGSWSNPEPLVKEDDPLIATPLALLALAA